MALELTTSNFDEAVRTHPFLVVDLWAEWCGPCRMIAPFLEEIERKYADRLVVGKVNVDEHPELAARFEVGSVPTLLFFRGGRQLPERVVGALPKDALERKIASLL